MKNREDFISCFFFVAPVQVISAHTVCRVKRDLLFFGVARSTAELQPFNERPGVGGVGAQLHLEPERARLLARETRAV